MAKKVPEWFLTERSRSLATVYLTRRGDVAISEGGREGGLDLLADIVRSGDLVERRFGVVLRATLSSSSAEQANKLIEPTMETLRGGTAFAFPVVLFFFTMEDDQGYYTWIAEPIVARDGNAILERHARAMCDRLETRAVNVIVEKVDRWYNALGPLAPRRGRRELGRNGLNVLHRIIDKEAAFFSEHGKPPRSLRLPVSLAYELAKLGRDHLGELSAKIIHKGITALQEEGLLGMSVILDKDATDVAVE